VTLRFGALVAGTTAEKPAATAVPGVLYFDLSLSTLSKSDGATWIDVPLGGGGGGGDITGLVGRVLLDTGTATVTVTHDTVDTLTDYPVVSLEVSSSASDLLITGIYDRTANSFKVGLSGNPATGSYLCWHLAVPSGLPSDISASYGYDLSGKMTSMTTSRGTVTFAYNPDGTMASATGTGAYQTKTFTWSAGKLITKTVT
jgi:hypothetical protein